MSMDAPIPGGFYLLLRPNQISLSPDLLWPAEAVRPPPEAPEVVAGEWGGRPVRALWAEGWWEGPWHPLREVYPRLDPSFWTLVVRGLTLLHWKRTHRHCGVCGGPLVEDPDEGALKCPACGHAVWPRISPAVIVLVSRGDEVLLGHNARMAEGVYSLLAGYVEPGESAEEAVLREVREESGVEIQGLRYLGSQPWPFPDSLMLGFRAEWRSGEPRPDGVEITDVRWFAHDRLPELPGPGSMARRLLEAWVAEVRSRTGRG